METSQLESMYSMVCSTPNGVSLHIDRLPDMFRYDDMDNTLPHVHTFYEIIWFQEGGGTHSVDFDNYEVKPNTILFLSPGQIHHFNEVTSSKGVIIKFCTNFLREDEAMDDIFIKYNMFNAFDSVPCYRLDDTVSGRLQNLVDAIETEMKNEDAFGHIDLLRSLVKMFIIFIQRHSTHADAADISRSKSSHRLFLMFRKLLEQQYRSVHTVQEYADMLGVSSKTLSKCISECSGKAPLTFINDRIILEAKRLLRFSNMIVKEVGFYLGYDDPSYFVKFFKRQTGFLPTDFQKKS